MCKSTQSLTSALDGGQWLTPPAALPLEKLTRYPFYRKVGEFLSRCGLVQNVFPHSGFDHPAVQVVASRYTDYAILARTETYVANVSCNCRVFVKY